VGEQAAVEGVEAEKRCSGGIDLVRSRIPTPRTLGSTRRPELAVEDRDRLGAALLRVMSSVGPKQRRRHRADDRTLESFRWLRCTRPNTSSPSVASRTGGRGLAPGSCWSVSVRCVLGASAPIAAGTRRQRPEGARQPPECRWCEPALDPLADHAPRHDPPPRIGPESRVNGFGRPRARV